MNLINSRILAKALEENSVPFVFKEFSNTPHGVGFGKELPFESWFDQAVSFGESRKKEHLPI